MQIIETFLCGKENNPNTCEDGIYIGKNLIVVIDGATSDGDYLWNGQKSGCYAKNLILSYLKNLHEDRILNIVSDENSDIKILTLFDSILKENISMSDKKDLDIKEFPRASVILYNNIKKEIINYGDCQCSINGKVHSHIKKVDILNAMLRSFYLEFSLASGYTIEELLKNDIGRIKIKDNLEKQCMFENKEGEFGYPTLNGRGINPLFIRKYKVEEEDEIILASDGYPDLKSDLKSSEEYLQILLQEDPLCFRQNPSTKGIKAGNISFDDRVFCRFKA